MVAPGWAGMESLESSAPLRLQQSVLPRIWLRLILEASKLASFLASSPRYSSEPSCTSSSSSLLGSRDHHNKQIFSSSILVCTVMQYIAHPRKLRGEADNVINSRNLYSTIPTRSVTGNNSVFLSIKAVKSARSQPWATGTVGHLTIIPRHETSFKFDLRPLHSEADCTVKYSWEQIPRHPNWTKQRKGNHRIGNRFPIANDNNDIHGDNLYSPDISGLTEGDFIPVENMNGWELHSQWSVAKNFQIQTRIMHFM